MTLLLKEEIIPTFEDLVGEGKKYADNEALAKSKYHADKHISNLENELRELREDLSKREQVQDLISKFEQKLGTSTPREEPTPVEQPVETNKGLSEQDVQSLVDKYVSEKETKRTREGNIDDAKKKLRELYGDKYADILKARSQELGMSIERMTELAAESPNALIKLVSDNHDKKEDLVSPLRGSRIQSSAQPKGDVRNYAYWQKMRKENPRLYHDPKMSWQRMKDSSDMGDAFYS